MADERIAPPRRVLLIQTRQIGDVVVSTALLEQLHAAHPGIACDWLADRATVPLLEHQPLIGERLALDNVRVLRTARMIRRRRYDWVIDVQGSWRSALVTRLSGSPARVGWKGLDRGWAYSHRVARAGKDSTVYVVRDRARLLAALGVPAVSAEPRLYLAHEERARGTAQVDALAPGQRRVGLLVSTRFPHKDWAPEKFAAVARALAAEGVASIVFRAPGGGAQESQFAAAAGNTARFAPAVDLRGLMALIAACDLFLSADTGPAHIATALGVPRVTVYGPTPATGWTPDSPFAIAVRDTAARCPACAGQAGDDAHTCLATVTPAMVLGPVRELLRNIAPTQHPVTERAAPTAEQRGGT